MLDADGVGKQSTPRVRVSKDTAPRDADATPSARATRAPWIRPKQPRPETIELTDAVIGARAVAAHEWSGRTWSPASAAAGQRVLVTRIEDKTSNGQGGDEYVWAWAKEEGGREPTWLAVRSDDLDLAEAPRKWIGVFAADGENMEVYDAKTFERYDE